MATGLQTQSINRRADRTRFGSLLLVFTFTRKAGARGATPPLFACMSRVPAKGRGGG